MKLAIIGSRGLHIADLSPYIPKNVTEIVSVGAPLIRNKMIMEVFSLFSDLFYLISCSNSLNSLVSKNSAKVISRPSHMIFKVKILGF